jgi:preprotein translocase subunit SecF
MLLTQTKKEGLATDLNIMQSRMLKLQSDKLKQLKTYEGGLRIEMERITTPEQQKKMQEEIARISSEEIIKAMLEFQPKAEVPAEEKGIGDMLKENWIWLLILLIIIIIIVIAMGD